MRQTLILLTLLLNAGLVLSQPAFDFEKKVLKFDKTPEGQLLEFEYPFINKGDAPLIISEIKVACSCTRFTFPQEPILPGKSGIIKVSFDTKGKIGYQDRTLEIYSNSGEKPEVVRFRVVVQNK